MILNKTIIIISVVWPVSVHLSHVVLSGRYEFICHM